MSPMFTTPCEDLFKQVYTVLSSPAHKLKRIAPTVSPASLISKYLCWNHRGYLGCYRCCSLLMLFFVLSLKSPNKTH